MPQQHYSQPLPNACLCATNGNQKNLLRSRTEPSIVLIVSLIVILKFYVAIILELFALCELLQILILSVNQLLGQVNFDWELCLYRLQNSSLLSQFNTQPQRSYET